MKKPERNQAKGSSRKPRTREAARARTRKLKPGAEFERLAAQLEAVLGPVGARVKSPDRILDKITGQSREVDASIRMKAGSTDLLVTLECRERTRLADTTWIEQLATKRHHIGANQTIAVSSKGFSAPAIRAATMHGIELRMISDLTESQILESFASRLKVETHALSLDLGKLTVSFTEPATPPPILVPTEDAKWARDGWDARVFVDETTGAELSLGDVFSQVAKKARTGVVAGSPPPYHVPPHLPEQAKALLPFFPDLPAEGTPVARTISVHLDGLRIGVHTLTGLRLIRRIDFGARMSLQRTLIPARGISYNAPEGPIASFAEHRLTAPDASVLSIISKRVDEAP